MVEKWEEEVKKIVDAVKEYKACKEQAINYGIKKEDVVDFLLRCRDYQKKNYTLPGHKTIEKWGFGEPKWKASIKGAEERLVKKGWTPEMMEKIRKFGFPQVWSPEELGHEIKLDENFRKCFSRILRGEKLSDFTMNETVSIIATDNLEDLKEISNQISDRDVKVGIDDKELLFLQELLNYKKIILSTKSKFFAD